MKNNPHKQIRIMAITPSSRGFGFAVLDTPQTLVEWRSTAIKGKNKNTEALSKAEKVLAHHMPDILILQDHSVASSRRSKRVKALNKRIIACAGARKVKVKLFTHEQIRQTFFGEVKGTKQALAEILAKRFPEELEHLLPPTRRAWMSEDARMDTFDAVALVLVPGLKAAAKAAQSNEGTIRI
jgi:Holliday junction resolvasome RuvABC endonuclease subunit